MKDLKNLKLEYDVDKTYLDIIFNNEVLFSIRKVQLIDTIKWLKKIYFRYNYHLSKYDFIRLDSCYVGSNANNDFDMRPTKLKLSYLVSNGNLIIKLNDDLFNNSIIIYNELTLTKHRLKRLIIKFEEFLNIME